MTILAMVNAEKEGQIESKVMKARQLEEIREAKRKEAEARHEHKKSKFVHHLLFFQLGTLSDMYTGSNKRITEAQEEIEGFCKCRPRGVQAINQAQERKEKGIICLITVQHSILLISMSIMSVVSINTL